MNTSDITLNFAEQCQKKKIKIFKWISGILVVFIGCSFFISKEDVYKIPSKIGEAVVALATPVEKPSTEKNEKTKEPPKEESQDTQPAPQELQEQPNVKEESPKAPEPITYIHVSEPVFGFSFDFPEKQASQEDLDFRGISGRSAIMAPLKFHHGVIGVDFSYNGEGLENYIKRKYSNLYNHQNYQIISDDTAILNYPNGFIAKIIVKNKPVINDRGDAISSGRQYYMKFTINGNINDPANSDVKHVLDSFTVD